MIQDTIIRRRESITEHVVAAAPPPMIHDAYRVEPGRLEWCAQEGLNFRPVGYQPTALPLSYTRDVLAIHPGLEPDLAA